MHTHLFYLTAFRVGNIQVLDTYKGKETQILTIGD
jgi:hypothetical protein